MAENIKLYKNQSQVFPETKFNYITSNDSEPISLTTALSNKQDTLVSGTNIKTINNVSILGNGNITVGGSGNGQENVIESIKLNGTEITPENKAVDLTTSLDGRYQLQESGKGLSANDFTSSLLSKLNNLPTVVYATNSEMTANSGSAVYSKLTQAYDADKVPPILTWTTEITGERMACQLSVSIDATDNNNKVFSGVFGSSNKLTQIIISSGNIETFLFQFSD